MFRHRPSCLEGPVSRGLARWTGQKPPTASAKGCRDNRSSDGIRVELVVRIRQAIAAGHYETPEKWEAALEQLFERLQETERTS